jgi:glycosyltransferase involved in cell wall biosynthesis
MRPAQFGEMLDPVENVLNPSDNLVATPALSTTMPRGLSPSLAAAVPPDVDLLPPIRSISIVIPVFHEEGNLVELHRRLTGVLAEIGLPYEIVFVDDGSKDGTWRVIKELRAEDPRIVALRHRRNFGKARGLANGFAIARGDAVITMDGDLQDDPDELPRFIEALNNGADLASGWKQRRQDPLGKTAPSRVFNWTVRKVSGVQLHDFNCGFKAYRREVTQNIRLYGELHRFTPVLANAEGFRIVELPVKHHPRTWGSSKYGWSRLFKGFLDLVTVAFLTKYRQRPMHLFGLPGLVSIIFGVVVGIYLTIERLAFNAHIGARPLLLLAVLLIIIGVQFFGLGIIGEFLTHGSNTPGADPQGSTREAIGLTDRVLPAEGSV